MDWANWSTKLQACSAVTDRLVSQARGYDFEVLSPVREDLHWLQLLIHLCLACLRGSHCLSVRRCLLSTLSIWRRKISTHTAHRPDGRCSVFWELYYRQGKWSAAQSSRAASSRTSCSLTGSPCSWSSNKKANKLSAADEPWSNARRHFLFLRQDNRKNDARKPRSLVRRFAERLSNPKFGIAIFEYSRPATSRNDLEFSICRRSILWRMGMARTPNRMHWCLYWWSLSSQWLSFTCADIRESTKSHPPIWHRCPVNPFKQTHETCGLINRATLWGSKHTPPFRHGLGLHEINPVAINKSRRNMVWTIEKKTERRIRLVHVQI